MKERKAPKIKKRVEIIRTIISSYGLTKLTDEDLNNRDKMGALIIRLEADIALITQNPHLLSIIIKNNKKYGNQYKESQPCIIRCS